MKKILYFAAVLSAFMTSCNSENEIIDNNPAKGTSTITATFDQPASRVQMGTSDGTHTPLQWNEGDQLVVYNVTTQNYGLYRTASSVQNGDAEAVFNFVAGTGSDEIIPAEPHLAAYPFARISSNNTFAFQYATTQAYTANSFDPLAMPMIASNASGTEFTFSAQAAVLRLKVSTTASAVTVSSIHITSANKALTGYADADIANGTYGVPTRSTGKTVTLNCATPVAINGTPTVFNIVVPGQTYPSGDLTITVKTNKGVFAKTSKADATFEAGKVYNLTISGVPTPTTGTAATGIGNVGWVQLWAGGPKFAEKNIGASSATDEGSELNFSQATAGGNTYAWGSLWCTPSKDDLQELLKAASSSGSVKVACSYTQESGVWGFKFTGRTAGYESNSVFFPAYDSASSGNGDADYWSGTAYGGNGWVMSLYYYRGWRSNWVDQAQQIQYRVRPVLK